MSNPMQLWNAWFALSSETARLGFEAQRVIAMRMMRLAGGGAAAEAESRRMISEKIDAFAEAHAAAAAVMAEDGDHHRAAKKVLNIYKKRVRGNSRRLQK
jgi:hypothetical protein